jgi:CheY-like chemotaxis protein
VKILYVDDEADAREYITTALEQHGIGVTAVTTVAEALCVLERSRPDVLLSDIRMPDEDGYALIQKVRALFSPFGMAHSDPCYNSLSCRRPSKSTKSRFSVPLA